MILDKKSATRFAKLYFSLLTYANDRLKIAEFTRDITYAPYATIHAIGSALWEEPANRHLVADYVRDNPDRLGRRDLQEVERWEGALAGDFLSVYDGRDTLFLYEGHTFCVRGISEEIAEVADGDIAEVTTTLLPFESVIVFAYSMITAPLSGDAIIDHMRDIMRARTAKKLIRSARDFVKLVPEIEAERLAQAAKRLAGETEAELSEDGQHRSPLSGIYGKERVQAQQRLAREREDYPGERKDNILSAIRDGADADGDRIAFRDALASLSREGLIGFATIVGIEGDLDSMDREEIIQEAIKGTATTRRATLTMMRESGPDLVRRMRDLIEAGGTLEVSYDEIDNLRQVPQAKWPFYHYSDTGSSFVLHMPTEFVELLKDADFDELEEQSRNFIEACRFFQAIVDLRGVEYVSEARDEYTKYAGARGHEALEEDLNQALTSGVPTFTFVPCMVDDRRLLVNEEFLIGHSDEREGPEVDERGVLDVLDMQMDKPARPLTQEMLDHEFIGPWLLDTPAAHDLIEFLDTHVPDDQDDLYFADDFTGDLFMDFRQPTNVNQSVRDEIHLMNLKLTAAQTEQVRDLGLNLSLNAPNWNNRGWSALELQEIIKSGRWTMPATR